MKQHRTGTELLHGALHLSLLGSEFLALQAQSPGVSSLSALAAGGAVAAAVATGRPGYCANHAWENLLVVYLDRRLILQVHADLHAPSKFNFLVAQSIQEKSSERPPDAKLSPPYVGKGPCQVTSKWDLVWASGKVQRKGSCRFLACFWESE